MPPSLYTSAFFGRDLYSDITIKYGTKTMKCHKIILCGKSEYFANLYGPTSIFAESKQSMIELKEDDEDAVEAMIRWLYTSDYTENHGEADDSKAHLEVLLVADKYGIKALSDKAHNGFVSSSMATDDDEALSLVINILYGDRSYPEKITRPIRALLDQRLPVLLKDTDFRTLMKQVPSLNDMVADRLIPMADLEEVECVTCSTCQTTALRRPSNNHRACSGGLCPGYQQVLLKQVWRKPS